MTGRGVLESGENGQFGQRVAMASRGVGDALESVELRLLMRTRETVRERGDGRSRVTDVAGSVLDRCVPFEVVS